MMRYYLDFFWPLKKSKILLVIIFFKLTILRFRVLTFMNKNR